MRIHVHRLFRDGFTVTDRDQPGRVFVVYRDQYPRAYDALRELELDMAWVTPSRERHLHGVIAAAWQARDAAWAPSLAVQAPALRPAA